MPFTYYSPLAMTLQPPPVRVKLTTGFLKEDLRQNSEIISRNKCCPSHQDRQDVRAVGDKRPSPIGHPAPPIVLSA